jgi:hypothetical protein
MRSNRALLVPPAHGVAGAAKPAMPVPAAASDRVAEAALGCLLALLRGAFAAEPWDAPAGYGAGAAAGAEQAGAAAEGGAAAGAGAEPEQGQSAGAAAEQLEPGPADPGPAPAPGVLVDLLQRVAALAELGPSHAAEEVHCASLRNTPCKVSWSTNSNVRFVYAHSGVLGRCTLVAGVLGRDPAAGRDRGA